MKKKFLKVTQDSHFFDKHKKVLIAVSAGKDSMCLLECLLAARNDLEIDIAIAHVNHKQRIESDEEETYLKHFASQHHIPIFIASYKDSRFSEKAARDFRYHFFEQIMREKGYSALVTAHHADDQAETIFMRLLRGSRLLHLTGIVPVQDFGPGQLIRPLLTFKKSELQASVYFEDSSNHENTYLRNRIRNKYLPQLQQENPNFSDSLIVFGQENQQLFQAFRDLTTHIEVTNLAVFQKQTPAVQSILLQIYLENFPELQLSRGQFRDVLTILQTKANYNQSLKNGYFLHKDYETFEISKIHPKTDRKNTEFVIESEGIFEFDHYLFSLNQPLPHSSHVLLVEEKKPILLRYRKPGDKLVVNGINKKLRRYFIDEKISQERRSQAIIIEQAKNILGIANLVTSDLSKSLKNDIMRAKLYIKTKE